MYFKAKIKLFVKKIVPSQIIFFLGKYILVRPSIQMLKNLYKIFSFPVRNYLYEREIKKNENKGQYNDKNIFNLFNKVNDDFWYWLHTKGYKKSSAIQKILPSMPEENLQLQFTGSSGEDTLEEAYAYYRFIKKNMNKYRLDIHPNTKILDFGCGWGRIIRLFMKDVKLENLFGIDCDDTIVKVCKSLNLNCNIDVNNIYPPTEFEDNCFDLIYSFSVFSHLSEDAHKKWIGEFKRILKPNGILIVTTRSREFIISCSKMRDIEDENIPFFAKGLTNIFLNPLKSLMDYDEGKYLYESIGGGGMRDGSFYGETCIPPKYVEKEWIKYFYKVNFIGQKKHKLFNQSAIIAIKD
jgi:ubiquinone/menaquinone biosynthesis C-methylase UbiE